MAHVMVECARAPTVFSDMKCFNDHPMIHGYTTDDCLRFQILYSKNPLSPQWHEKFAARHKNMARHMPKKRAHVAFFFSSFGCP